MPGSKGNRRASGQSKQRWYSRVYCTRRGGSAPDALYTHTHTLARDGMKSDIGWYIGRVTRSSFSRGSASTLYHTRYMHTHTRAGSAPKPRDSPKSLFRGAALAPLRLSSPDAGMKIDIRGRMKGGGSSRAVKRICYAFDESRLTRGLTRADLILLYSSGCSCGIWILCAVLRFYCDSRCYYRLVGKELGYTYWVLEFVWRKDALRSLAGNRKTL